MMQRMCKALVVAAVFCAALSVSYAQGGVHAGPGVGGNCYQVTIRNYCKKTRDNDIWVFQQNPNAFVGVFTGLQGTWTGKSGGSLLGHPVYGFAAVANLNGVRVILSGVEYKRRGQSVIEGVWRDNHGTVIGSFSGFIEAKGGPAP